MEQGWTSGLFDLSTFFFPSISFLFLFFFVYVFPRSFFQITNYFFAFAAVVLSFFSLWRRD